MYDLISNIESNLVIFYNLWRFSVRLSDDVATGNQRDERRYRRGLLIYPSSVIPLLHPSARYFLYSNPLQTYFRVNYLLDLTVISCALYNRKYYRLCYLNKLSLIPLDYNTSILNKTLKLHCLVQFCYNSKCINKQSLDSNVVLKSKDDF